MHVVLSGYYGYNNAGDEAILHAIVSSLRRFDPAIAITVLSAQPEATARLYRVNAVHRMDPLSVYRALRNADALVSGGGSLLQDASGFRSIPYYAGIIAMAQWCRKPVFIYAQGIGPIRQRRFYPLIRSTFRRAAYISVRDEGSAKLLAELGIARDRIELVADPVLTLQPAPSQEIDAIVASHNLAAPFVAVSVRHWRNNRFLAEVAAALDRLAERGYAVVLLPLHPPNDVRACQTVQRLMRRRKQTVLLDSPLTPPQWLGLIGRAALVIGVRLHALVFAAAQHVPMVGISYDPKIDHFLRQLGDAPVGTTETVSTAALVEAALRKLEAGEEERRRLAALVTPLRELAWRPAQAIVDHFRVNRTPSTMTP
ncbi:MAG TPA: polysaccharide pyruvyl transferase CsaB [Calditerricola sp.]